MRFYYVSLLSWAVYVVYGAIAIALLSLLWRKFLRLTFRNPAYWALAVTILIAPWIEELWIAYNFDRLCRKDAGMFINKTVEVDGYYNDTGTINRLVGGPPYKFIEAPEGDGKYRRVERATEQEKLAAMAWYSESKGKLPEKEWITHLVSKDTRIVVEMDTGYAWRITRLDKPTARYHYKTINSHTSVGHEIKQFENVVIDTHGGEMLGRYTNYYRGPYWFFISLGAPTIPCAETESDVRARGTLSVDALTLKPSK